MVKDYPSNYYGLLRVVNQQIKDRLKALVADADLARATGKPVMTKQEVTASLHVFIRDLSINTGLPKKKLYDLLADQGMDLRSEVLV